MFGEQHLSLLMNTLAQTFKMVVTGDKAGRYIAGMCSAGDGLWVVVAGLLETNLLSCWISERSMMLAGQHCV